MQILFICNSSKMFWRFRESLVRRLVEGGNEIALITPVDGEYDKLSSLGIRVHALDFDRKSFSPIKNLKILLKLRQLIKRENSDLLISYTVKPNTLVPLASLFLRKKIFCVVTGLGSAFLHSKLATILMILLHKVSFKLASRVIFLNTHDRDFFIQNKIVPLNKTTVFPGEGINLNDFPRVDYHYDEDAKIFLFIGRLLRDKGILELLDAAKSLSETRLNVKFKIVGGPYAGNPSSLTNDEIQKFSKLSNVEFLGERTDISELIARCWCVVLPSYREGISRVLLEASATGRPMITTNVPGCKDIVKDGLNGFLVEPKSSPALTQACLKMAKLEIRVHKHMGIQALQIVSREFSDDRVYKCFLALI